MRKSTIVLSLVLLAGCTAPQSKQEDSDAVEDFVAISDLKEVGSIRTIDRFEYDYLTDRYVIVNTRRSYRLVEFYGRCRELTTRNMDVQPDFRYDAKTLNAGEDTIRGCRIKTVYEIDKVQAEELKQIGEAPGEDRNTIK